MVDKQRIRGRRCPRPLGWERAKLYATILFAVFAVTACGGVEETPDTNGDGTRVTTEPSTEVSESADGTEAASTTVSCAGGGISEPIELEPFVFDQPAGVAPKHLPKVIAWANSSDAEFFLQITRSIEQAANDRGLEFTTAIADGDPVKNIEQIETFLQRGIGGLTIQPIDVNAQAPVMERAIQDGIAVMSMITPPTTSITIEPLYDLGYQQGLAAAKYITEELDGEAKVVHFHTDTIELLQARHQGAIDGIMTAGDGVEIVADEQPDAISQDAAFEAMNSILQANPEVDVVYGGDTYVLGALAALEAADAVRPEMYLSGLDGDEQALAKIAEGGVYRVSYALPYPLVGYAWGQFAADWLEGKPIPQVVQQKPVVLDSAEAIEEFNSDMSSVSETWQTAEKYMEFFGSISYETCGDYLTYVPDYVTEE